MVPHAGSQEDERCVGHVPDPMMPGVCHLHPFPTESADITQTTSLVFIQIT